MNRRVLLLVLLVVVLLAVGVIFVLPLLNPPAAAPTPVADQGGGTAAPTATPVVLQDVVVAVQQLPRGIAIPASALALRAWPQSSVPERAMTKIEDVAGKIARTDIFIEEPIVDTLLVADIGQLARKGSDAAAITPKGRVLISVPVDRLTDVGYAVQDGDYVDVIVSFLFVDVDPNFQSEKPNKLTIMAVKPDGTVSLQPAVEGELAPSNFGPNVFLVSGPNEQQRPRLVTQRTIQAAWVVHAGNFPLDGQFLRPISTPIPTPTPAEGEPTKPAPPPTATPPFPDIVNLAVEPQDAVTLAWIIEAKIPITLVLRSAQGDPTAPAEPTTSVSLSYMIETFQIAQPPSLPYALEPALRSIRSLEVGNQISLTQP